MKKVARLLLTIIATWPAGAHAQSFRVESQEPEKRLAIRPSLRSTRLRLLPTFLTAFLTAALDRLDFFAAYRTS